MKKINKIIYKMLLLLMLTIICSSNVCYAAIIDSPSSFKPGTPTMGKATDIISGISGALMVIGIILIVVFISIIGFNTILGSASEKALAKEKFVGLLIAAVLLTGGSVITTIIIKIAESF